MRLSREAQWRQCTQTQHLEKHMKQPHRGTPRALFIAITGLGLLGCHPPAAQPCTISDNGDGTSKLSCPDGTSVTVSNGKNGEKGTSCSVSTDADAGTKTVSCTDGTSVTVRDGNDANAIVDFMTLTPVEVAATDLSITVNSVSDADHPVASFTVRDAKGRGIKGIPPVDFTGIGLLQLVPGTASATDAGNGLAIDTWVSHIANCATCMVATESGTTAGAKLVDLGNGNYTYTFAKDVRNPLPFDGGTAVPGVIYDSSAVHRFGIGLRVTATTNPDGGVGTTLNGTRPANAVLDYIPATGVDVTGKNDKVNTDNCLECHGLLRANANNAGGAMLFHNGQRYDTRYCPICHNDQRKYGSTGTAVSGNPVRPEPAIDYATGNMDGGAGVPVLVIHGDVATNFPVWIHKIHMGKRLFLKGTYPGGPFGTELNKVGFPQSPANCVKCHRRATQADNWKTRPSRRACGACHDRVDFKTGLNHGPSNVGQAQADDSQCAVCHAGSGSLSPTEKRHIPVAPIDPNASLLGGTNANTNAAWLGNADNRPAGARFFTYDLPDAGVSVITTSDGALNVQVRFRMQEGTTSVVFNPYDGGASAELINGFTGSPSVYCVFSMPQDGITNPADFNASVSGNLKSLWNGKATGLGTGSLSGPDTSGYYTVQLTGVGIPREATHLTCGLGYTYNLGNAKPLTQIDLSTYPYDGGTGVGGLSIPSPNVWRVANGYSGRRGQVDSFNVAGQIVSNAKCHNCHNALGVSPSFHSGQRNNGASCAFCHTPNRTSNGWAAGSSYYLHAIHGTAMRTVPYNWNAISEKEGFYEIRFPGRAQMCETCHNPGFYDFSATWYNVIDPITGRLNIDTRAPQTAAVGMYSSTNQLPDGGANVPYRNSPYIKTDGVTNYGAGWAFDAGTGGWVEAADTTLVHSPTASACFACHDADRSVNHMRANGGQLYSPRSEALKAPVEQCLICHGPGKIGAIKDVHYQ